MYISYVAVFVYFSENTFIKVILYKKVDSIANSQLQIQPATIIEVNFRE